MKKSNNFVFTALKVVAWLIFVGLSIEAGSLIVNFVFSLVRPEFVQNLYQKLDLSGLYEHSRPVYFGMYGFILAIALLKVFMFYIVIRLLSRLDLSKPFSSFVSAKITQISYHAFSIGLISYIGGQIAKSLPHYGYAKDNLNEFWADSEAFILMAAVIYVIAAIFSRGVELQNENDLTI